MTHEPATTQPKITMGKILLYGNEAVGKTCLFLRFAEDTFSSNYDPTIGCDFEVKTITLPNTEDIKLQIWDTPGQERFRNISKAYIRAADVVCILYDVTKSSSFENIQGLIKSDVENPDIIKFIVGNKSDMEEEREVTFDEGKKFADEQGYEFREVSAANGQGVNNLLLSVARAAYKKKHPESLTGWSSSATSLFF